MAVQNMSTEHMDDEMPEDFNNYVISASVDSPLITDSVQHHRVYSSRFWMLCMVSFQAIIWNLLWNTWGPISDSAKLVFGWKDGDIANFANIGNIPFIVLSIPSGWLLMKLGLRKCIIFCAILAFFSSGLRCISSSSEILYWMSNLCGISCGLAGPLIGSVPALFSSIWFPANERVFSTAVINMAQFLGVSLSMIVGPQIVHFRNGTTNHSEVSFSPNLFYYSADNENSLFTNNIKSNSSINSQRKEIMEYMYIGAGFSGFVLLMILIYFPASPPTAPSTSATVSRDEFYDSIKQLFRNCQFWCLVISYGLPVGLFTSWGCILSIQLEPHGIDQSMAGWIGFGQVTLGGLGNVMLSGISTMIARHMKAIVLFLYILLSLFLLWIQLLMSEIIPRSLLQFQISLILAGALGIAPQSIFFELASERFYPVDEGLLVSILVMVNCISGLIFLSIFQIVPNGNASWVTPVFLAITLLAIPFLISLKESYGRSTIDSEDVSNKISYVDIITENDSMNNEETETNSQDQLLIA